jgi:hypothetical protein
LFAKLARDSSHVLEAKVRVAVRTEKLIVAIRELTKIDEMFLRAKMRFNEFRRRRTQQRYVHLGQGWKCINRRQTRGRKETEAAERGDCG